MNKFREYRPNADKKIDLIGNGPEVEFETYGQKTKINIDTKVLVGFSPSRFDSFFELFKVANLTNRVKDICKDKKTVKKPPFYISAIGGNIMFDDAELVSTDHDTEIVTGGL